MRLAPAGLALLLPPLLANAVHAQAILGHVRDAATNTPVAVASLWLLDGKQTEVVSITSDTTGRFRLRAPRPGPYTLRVHALGYTPFESETLQLDNRVELQLEIRLSASALAVEPLRVVGRRNYANAGRLAEFHARAEWVRKTGFGDVYTRADIERINAPTVERLIGNSLVFVRPDGRVVSRNLCELEIFLDGQPIPQAARPRGGLTVDGLTSPEQIEGVEIYRTGMDVPPEFLQQTPCGAVLIWSRRDGGRRMTWPKIALAAVAVTGLLLLAR
jgi:hypothetical protein